jgi:hypothetical protein
MYASPPLECWVSNTCYADARQKCFNRAYPGKSKGLLPCSLASSISRAELAWRYLQSWNSEVRSTTWTLHYNTCLQNQIISGGKSLFHLNHRLTKLVVGGAVCVCGGEGINSVPTISAFSRFPLLLCIGS